MSDEEVEKRMVACLKASYTTTHALMATTCAMVAELKIPWVVAKGEADVVLANSANFEYVATIDSDLVVRGGKKILNVKNFWPDKWAKAELYDPSVIPESSSPLSSFADVYRRDPDNFLMDFAIFVGCDYSTVIGVG